MMGWDRPCDTVTWPRRSNDEFSSFIATLKFPLSHHHVRIYWCFKSLIICTMPLTRIQRAKSKINHLKCNSILLPLYINRPPPLFSFYWDEVSLSWIAEFTILATQKVIELSVFAFELATLTGHTVLSSIEDGVSYYRKNQENPRLFSQVLKQIIYQ